MINFRVLGWRIRMSLLNQEARAGFVKWHVCAITFAAAGFFSVLHSGAAPAETAPTTAPFANGPQAVHPLRGAIPGDWVLLDVYELEKPFAMYSDRVQVDDDGKIPVSRLGNVPVAGLTPRMIEEKIGQLAIEKGYLLSKGCGAPNPQVNVLLLAKEHANAPADTAAVPGDIVAVKLFGLIDPDATFSARVQVNEMGNLRVGPLGEVPVVGLSAKQMEEAILKAAGGACRGTCSRGAK
jgi:protein involved in polysaccharide export with SLBB domain